LPNQFYPTVQYFCQHFFVLSFFVLHQDHILLYNGFVLYTKDDLPYWLGSIMSYCHSRPNWLGSVTSYYHTRPNELGCFGFFRVRLHDHILLYNGFLLYTKDDLLYWLGEDCWQTSSSKKLRLDSSSKIPALLGKELQHYSLHSSTIFSYEIHLFLFREQRPSPLPKRSPWRWPANTS